MVCLEIAQRTDLIRLLRADGPRSITATTDTLNPRLKRVEILFELCRAWYRRARRRCLIVTCQPKSPELGLLPDLSRGHL
jgi:hypothetical protein